MFLTCGDWDLKTMLPLQHDFTASTDATFLPIDPLFRRWINVKEAFKSHLKSMSPLLSLPFLAFQADSLTPGF